MRSRDDSGFKSAVYCCAISTLMMLACSRSDDEDRSRDDTGLNEDAPTGSSSCGALSERLTVASVEVDEDIQYVYYGYNGTPIDSRIALAVQPNGESLVAWRNTAPNPDLKQAEAPISEARVHVTPLTVALERRGPDQAIAAFELGGLIAHDDGFALLVRQKDRGHTLPYAADDKWATVATLLRYRDDKEVFSVPLSGTDSPHRDCLYSPTISGQLAFNGSKYGAYFTVRGGEKIAAEGVVDCSTGHWGDRMTILAADGSFQNDRPRGGCGHNYGIRVLGDDGDFTGACIRDAPDAVSLIASPRNEALLVGKGEAAWAGYSGARFGSLTKLDDGTYLLGWLSCSEKSEGDISSCTGAFDIKLARLGADLTLIGEPTRITNTPDTHELNLHIAPYGDGRALMVWSSLGKLKCATGTCSGQFEGTSFRVFDPEHPSDAIVQETVQNVLTTSDDELAVFPNGDLGWAFARADADYSANRERPTTRKLSVVRMKLCRDE